MKKTQKLVSVIAAAAMAMSLAVTVSAEDETAVVAIEKFTIGGGFVFEPTAVEIAEGDTAADVFEKAYGAENFNYGEGAGTYISSVKTSSEGELLPEITDAITAAGGEVTAPADAEWLQGYDYYSMAGWMFLVNGQSSMVGAADYTVNNGDVLQLCFSAFGYGSDIGLDTSDMADWGGTAPLYDVADRTEYYKAADGSYDWDAVANVYATADELEAVVNGNVGIDETEPEVIIPDESEDTTETDEDTETAEDTETTANTAEESTDKAETTVTDNPATGADGVAVSAIIAVSALAVAAVFKKRG